MKVRTENLDGAALDWAVALAGSVVFDGDDPRQARDDMGRPWWPTSDWDQCGPLIEQHKLVVSPDPIDGWRARDYMNSQFWVGRTPLVAICRAAVALTLGDEVDVPEELMGVAA